MTRPKRKEVSEQPIRVVCGDHLTGLSAEELKFEPVNLESLRKDKNFIKATKKQQKDVETMRKRQEKEKMTVQKNQVAAIERIAKGRKLV